MPKPKSTPRKAKPTTARATKASRPADLTPEYQEYLERYENLGQGRPRLSSKEFDALDDELLELLDLAALRGLSDEQLVRLQELEFLLIDSE